MKNNKNKNKIGISFSGEGRGHAARVVAIAQELNKKYEVCFWCPNVIKPFITKKFPNAIVHSVPYIRLVKRKHRIMYWSTIFVNTRNILKRLAIIGKIRRQIKEAGIEIVISDYEPYLPIAAKGLRVPVLLLTHQGILFKYPVKGFKPLLTKYGINRFMMPYYNKLITSSFYDGDVGPIIRESLKKVKVKKENFIIVYIKKGFSKMLFKSLENFYDESFHIFPNPEKNFDDELARCKGIIAPAGHQIISEALFLKKPILVIPESGQYEQQLNASMLENSGRGMKASVKELDNKIIEFLKFIESYPLSVKDTSVKYIFNDDTHTAIKLIETFMQEHRR